MTFAISIGSWGGFYAEPGRKSWRLCLGFVAFTIFFQDLDYWLEDYVQLTRERFSNRYLIAIDVLWELTGALNRPRWLYEKEREELRHFYRISKREKAVKDEQH